MTTLLFALFLINLTYIIYQDFKNLEILLVSILISFSLQYFLYLKGFYSVHWMDIIVNITLLAFNFLIILIYYRIKEKSTRKNLKGLIGNGDLLFLISCSICFNTMYFLIFLVISFTVAALFGLILYSKKPLPLVSFIGITLLLFHLIKFYEFNFK